MADTSQHELSEPHTNGAVDGLTEEEKSKMRPADIDADMREMERRKRVEMMMNSRLFREELERIIETQMKDGGAGPSGLLQQISDMMGAQGARFNSNVFKSSSCVVPINDIRGVESMGYAKGEKLLRCKLAAVFRLLDLYGWTQGVGGHITARLNQDQEHFLVNPYGLLYHEVTASSLIKVDMQGSVVEQGTTNFGVHLTAFQLHSTIHAARPDIKCIIHITTPSVIAVSSLKSGLLPLGQESIVIGEASIHQYIGGVFEPEEKEKISRNLGPVNKIMFLTNRGVLCCGETVEEAFYNVYNTVLACETQLKLMPVGIDNLSLVSEESRKAIFDASRKPPIPQHNSVAEPSPLADKLEKRWRIGGTEFEALMRMLDNAGFRTGYIYRNPLIKGEPPRPRNDVEVPPAVSSLGYLLEEEELYKQGLWKGGRKGTDRSRWLNSPNVYQKVEILETGTPDPKKITKWVTDGSPTHSSTPVRIESALQFVPKNTNPKEFKQLQQQIKDYRRADKISAGPQSHILEGVSWDEAKKMQDATISGTGEQVVLVGAASKGIIQRGFQHNAMVYKTPYAKNPFDAITDQELDQYKKDVERKQKGDPYDESQSESEALSSFNISRATHESSTAKSPIQSPISVTSEAEEESRDEPRVLRIETKQVPLPSQPEVVLSDDCQSSNSSGVNSGQSYGWPNDRYDTIHLEVARSRTIAPRMIPMITEILHPTKNTNLALTNVKIKQPPPVPPKPKVNVALRHAFFNDFAHAKHAQVRADQTNLDHNSHIKSETLDVDVRVDKVQAAQVSELFNVYAQETMSVSRVKNKNLLESSSNYSDEVIESSKESVIISTDMFNEPIDRRGEGGTFFQRAARDESQKPVIVGAILKNINDLYTLCSASESKFDSIENGANPSDENGNLRLRDEHVNTDVINHDSTNGNSSNSAEFNETGNLNDQFGVLNDGENDSQDEFLTANKPIENNSPNVFATPPRDRNYLRLDTLTEVINSVEIDLTPTKLLLSMLPENNISSKYNLDSTNMNLIYSLTPTNDDADVESRVSQCFSEESFETNAGLKRLDSCNTDDSLHDEETDFIWVDLLTNAKKGSEMLNFLDSSMESLDNEDNTSNQGSDILELPYSTVKELRESDAESFNRDMKTVANQIIAELGDIEMYTHASNFIDEILYDISCLKLDQSWGKRTVSAVVRDKLQALTIAKEIANALIGNLPCFENSAAVLDQDDDRVIVIDTIVHHVVDKFKDSQRLSTDSYVLKKVKESANIELKEMQNNSKNDIERSSKSEINSVDDNNRYENAVDVMIIDIDDELNLVHEVDQVNSDADGIEIGANQNLGATDSSGNESFISGRQGRRRRLSSDERFFITLDTFSPSKRIKTIKSDESNSSDEPNELEERKVERTKNRSDVSCCQSPLDCDECSFIGSKKYQLLDDEDRGNFDLNENGTYFHYTNSRSSHENTESDVTDHDTLGETILEFCAIVNSTSIPESLELNFAIERNQETESKLSRDEELAHEMDNKNYEQEDLQIEVAECGQCLCCMGTMPIDLISPGQLPPISEEINESLDISICPSLKKYARVKTENEFDYLDSLAESEVLIAGWFNDDAVVTSSNNNKACQTHTDRSAISLESINTFDFHSCREDSNSTAFQSLQNTNENSFERAKDDDSDIEVVYVADKAGNKLDGTYTLSDTSLNSLDTVSSMESDEHKRAGEFGNATYSADVSTNIDEANFSLYKLTDHVSFSSSSDTRLSNDENCFDTSANMADISGNLLSNKYKTIRSSDEPSKDIGVDIGETQDCMVYSYETREFMLLEEALAIGTESNLEIVGSCSETGCDKLCKSRNKNADNVLLSPIDPPPRYEDTTLYRVISEINLNDDIIGELSPDVSDLLKC